MPAVTLGYLLTLLCAASKMHNLRCPLVGLASSLGRRECIEDLPLRGKKVAREPLGVCIEDPARQALRGKIRLGKPYGSFV